MRLAVVLGLLLVAAAEDDAAAATSTSTTTSTEAGASTEEPMPAGEMPAAPAGAAPAGFPLANTVVPSAWDPWGNPPPMSPFEASPYIPHPTFLSRQPQPYYHPAMGPHYMKMQMMLTPGFWSLNPRQLSLFYDPVNSPASQQSFHPLLNPMGLHLPNPLDQRPWMQMAVDNPKAFAAHTNPFMTNVQALSNTMQTMPWTSPMPVV